MKVCLGVSSSQQYSLLGSSTGVQPRAQAPALASHSSELPHFKDRGQAPVKTPAPSWPPTLLQGREGVPAVPP